MGNGENSVGRRHRYGGAYKRSYIRAQSEDM